MKKLLYTFLIFAFILVSCSEYNRGVYGDYESIVLGGQEDSIQQIENPFVSTEEMPISTFSIDADGGSYAVARRSILEMNTLPNAASVRTEEFINYFQMGYEYQNSEHPISFHGEISDCPWTEGNKLLRIGIKGKPLDLNEFGGSNFVFLVDVSGSMKSDDKLPLVQDGLKLLLPHLTSQDRISIVTYAGEFKTILAGEKGTNTSKIEKAIDKLNANGSTNGSGGIISAYDVAAENFISGGNNRIIMATDGDFNVGISDQDELIELIESERDQGIFLTTLGVGTSNYRESQMEQLANKGNGTYEYLDNAEQLIKVFVVERSKFFTVAKDVKVQIDFNPNIVASYRLIGYENRLLQTEDFEDDEKDAGEIGADQDITAYYELIPQENIDLTSEKSIEIDFRYKMPDSDESVPLSLEVFDEGTSFQNASSQHQFGASIIAFTMQLIESQYKGNATFDSALQWFDQSGIQDEYGYKNEFKTIVEKAKIQ